MVAQEKQERKTDIRIVKTHEAIRAAFEKLLETTSYPDITVSAVAREARISRKTFYVHYDSVSELLRQIVCEMINERIQEIQPEGELHSVLDLISEFTRLTLSTLRENPYLNNNVVRCLSLSSILEMVRKPLVKICSNELEKRGYGEIRGLETCLLFYLSGLCSVYEDWSLSGRSAAALDEEAIIITRAVSHGFIELLEQTKPFSYSCP